MKKSKFKEQQIAFAHKQAEKGISVEEVCRKMGIRGQVNFLGSKYLKRIIFVT